MANDSVGVVCALGLRSGLQKDLDAFADKVHDTPPHNSPPLTLPLPYTLRLNPTPKSCA